MVSASCMVSYCPAMQHLLPQWIHPVSSLQCLHCMCAQQSCFECLCCMYIRKHVVLMHGREFEEQSFVCALSLQLCTANVLACLLLLSSSWCWHVTLCHIVFRGLWVYIHICVIFFNYFLFFYITFVHIHSTLCSLKLVACACRCPMCWANSLQTATG